MKKFSERLKELRNEKDLSQAQLAKATGLSHTAIVYWETEQRVPNANAIIILAEFFGVTTDYLLGVDE
ncbi:MAG: helix-turn-helix domain-containing protein [Clostridia bacterium]|nr:helix-turn-helix domain-containing protein [Clostridia bacterium]